MLFGKPVPLCFGNVRLRFWLFTSDPDSGRLFTKWNVDEFGRQRSQTILQPVLCLCGICYYVFMNMLINISVDVFVYSLSVYFWQAPTCDMWVPWWFTDWGPHINCTMGKYKIHINWTIGKCKIHIHWGKYKIHINWRTGLVHLAKQGSLSQSWDLDVWMTINDLYDSWKRRLLALGYIV